MNFFYILSNKKIPALICFGRKSPELASPMSGGALTNLSRQEGALTSSALSRGALKHLAYQEGP